MKWKKVVNSGVLIGALFLIGGCEILKPPLPVSAFY